MSFTVEQKTQLAKLMATENLIVQHKKISTAKFDPKGRILYLPIWQNMTGVIYDLLCGHEVGHALYTPADGWHDASVDKSKPKNYKNFLNVIEDARIEKKIKRKYPGLTTQFKLAYQELNKRDFFNIRNRDVNELPFIDRLNLFSKSQWTSTWIKFSAQEELFVKKVQSAETWDDVICITDEIYAYSKEEQLEKHLQDFDDFEMSLNDYGDDFDYDNEYDDSSDNEYDDEESDLKSKAKTNGDGDEKTEENDGNDGDGNGEEGKETKSKSSSGNQNEEGEEKESNAKQGFNRFKESNESDKDQFSPSCETDESYRNNEVKLLDEKSKEYVYLSFPKPNIKNIITPAKRVQEQLSKFYGDCVKEKYFSADHGTKLVNEFKNKNERYIGLLAKEFEMRKAAKAFSKSKLSDTGDIDINRLATYKFDDNIFRKVLLTPKGKNHGLILLLDKSGSMSNNMSGSIEQILVLAMFCRKVNIPFVVYGFGDSVEAHVHDLGLEDLDLRRNYSPNNYRSFSSDDFELDFSNVRLREYMNNKMTNAEFNRCVKNMLLLKRSFEGGRHQRNEVPRPECENLSNTPLTQAVLATAEIMKNFKKSNNLDITNLVIVHDGDSDYTNRYFITNNENKKSTAYIHSYDYNYHVRDNQNKLEFKIKSFDDLNGVVMQWFTKVTGSKIFGFFIASSGRDAKYALNEKYRTDDGINLFDLKRIDYFRWETLSKELNKKIKNEKFVSCKAIGYDSFFLISGGEDLKTENDQIEIEGKVTASKLKTAFMKMNKKKAINRVLVSKFIQGIAV